MSLLAVLLVLAAPEEGRVRDEATQLAGSIHDMDYPADAIAAGAQGTTAVSFKVGTDGRVTNCVIAQSAGHESLDETSCRIVTERFRFAPARNRAGEAVESMITRRITWRLPPPEPADAPVPLFQFAAGTMRTTLGGPADQRPHCAVEFSGPTFTAQEAAACFGYQRATRAELLAAPFLFSTTMRLLPEGEAAPADLTEEGELTAAMAATIDVDPDGLVRGCTPVDTTTPPPANVPHICDGMAFGMQAFQPIGGTGTRRAAMRYEIRIRNPSSQTPAT